MKMHFVSVCEKAAEDEWGRVSRVLDIVTSSKEPNPRLCRSQADVVEDAVVPCVADEEAVAMDTDGFRSALQSLMDIDVEACFFYKTVFR